MHRFSPVSALRIAGARSAMQPPVLLIRRSRFSSLERFHYCSHILKRQFIKRGLRLWHLAKINQPSILTSLDYVTANQSALHHV